jgi:hypothetical protein
MAEQRPFEQYSYLERDVLGLGSRVGRTAFYLAVSLGLLLSNGPTEE